MIVSEKNPASLEDTNLILEQIDRYICVLAARHVPHQVTTPETRDLEVDELAQAARIKLWHALEKKHIVAVPSSGSSQNERACGLPVERVYPSNPKRSSGNAIGNLKAYVRSIIYHESVNMVRAHKNVLPLLECEEDEFMQHKSGMALREEIQDPLRLLVQEEQMSENAHLIAEAITELPPRQQWAMMCELKEHIEDILPLIDSLLVCKEDVLATEQPKDKKEAQGCAALLSVSRKKLRARLLAAGK